MKEHTPSEMELTKSIIAGLTLLALFVSSCATQQSAAPNTLKSAFKKDFHMGVAVNQRQFTEHDTNGVAIITSQYNSISPENVLKWESVHPRPGTNGYDFEGADAYVALFPSLYKVVLPTGVADLARNIPPRDVTLLAVETSLVVRKNLHPALQYLLLEAASQIHGGPDVFHKAGRFPAAEAINLPLSTPAREFYQSGLPFVYQVLPLWLAGITQRLLILLIPMFVLVFPAIRFLPAVYSYIIERRIYKLYGELMTLEAELDRGSEPAPYAMATRLEDLARRANRLSVPLRFSQRLFILKSHIALAREELGKRPAAMRPVARV